MDFEQSQRLKIAALNIVIAQYGRTLLRWLREKRQEELEEQLQVDWRQAEAKWRIRRPIWEAELAEIRGRDAARAAQYHQW